MRPPLVNLCKFCLPPRRKTAYRARRKSPYCESGRTRYRARKNVLTVSGQDHRTVYSQHHSHPASPSANAARERPGLRLVETMHRWESYDAVVPARMASLGLLIRSSARHRPGKAAWDRSGQGQPSGVSENEGHHVAFPILGDRKKADHPVHA